MQDVVRSMEAQIEQSKAEVETDASAQNRIAQLQDENARIRADAKDADTSSQALSRKLEGELAQAHSVHLSCDFKVHERDNEIAHLRAECKKLIGARQQQIACEATKSNQKLALKLQKLKVEVERDSLAAELEEVKESYKLFREQKAEEHERLTYEILRLQGSMFPGDTAPDDNVVLENSQLKETIHGLQADLQRARTQYSNSVQSNTALQAHLDGVLSRHAADIQAFSQAAAEEDQIDCRMSPVAMRRIEELEEEVSKKSNEVCNLFLFTTLSRPNDP
ncbi:hypothetical protein C8Q79DRAFT_655863 [Trametes meyenii]|nr:hypothetical protein C8Q79DRAFT_655863 [Trametes meyenii]